MDASGGGGGHRGGQSRAAKKRAKKRNKNNDRKRRLEQQQKRQQQEEEEEKDREQRKRRHPGDHTEEEGGTAATTTTARGPDPADEGSSHRRRRRKNGEGGENGAGSSDGGGDDGSSSSASATGGAHASTSTSTSTSAPPTLAEIIRSIVAAEGEGCGEGKVEGGGEAEDEAGDDDLSPADLTAEERGRLILRSILHPAVTVEEFYDTYWEKLPLHVSATASSSSGNPSPSSEANCGTSGEGRRGDAGKHTAKGATVHHGRDRLDGILSLGDIEEMISDKCLRYKYDLNVTRCDESTGMRRVNFDHNGEDNVGTTKKGGKVAAAPCVDKYDKDEAADEVETDGGDNDISSSPPEIVDPEVIWPRFKEGGCTIRMLCPQKHSDRLHAVLSTLESEFGCMVGCNAYLTPGRASRGFAPHYDDIEAFVLQVEGRKRWRVYRPINGGETLPRVSSDDFVMIPTGHDSDSDDNEAGGLAAGLTRRHRRHDRDGRRRVVDEPVLDVTLEPGDVLYMPRGWIHHAVTPTNERGHSLHLTVSCMQNWAWADLMELIVPEALASAVQDENSTRLREGLPRNFLSYMGAVHDTADGEDIEGLKQAEEDLRSNGDDDARRETGRDSSTRAERRKEKLRRKFKEEAKKCINHICLEAISMLDAGCDQIGKRFLSDRLPPALTGPERSTTNEASASAGASGIRLMPDTMCRLVRDGIARLVLEDGRAVLYHCADNSREFHGNPLSPMEFELDDAPAIEQLLTTSATEWVRVRDLTHDEIEDKIGIAQALFDEGILSIYQPTA